MTEPPSNELPGNEDALRDRLQGLLRGLASKRMVHHAIVAIERVDGSFRWAGSIGPATPGGPPMRADTPYFLASITKLHIATVVMKLSETGLIDLDEPMTAYLPGELTRGLHEIDGVDRSGSISVMNLLGHTSGLPDYLEERGHGGKSLVETIVEDGDRAWGIDEVVRIVREELTPHFPPQGPEADRPRARYSDTNYRLLVAVVEQVTGRPMHDVLDELIVRPLGLERTWLPGRSPRFGEAPEPAALWYRDRLLDIPLAMASFGDLYSTADDTLRFLRVLLRGEIVDEATTLATMRSRWIRFGFPRDPAALRTPGWPIEYGLGLMRFRFRLPRVRTPGGETPTLMGHSGSTGSWLFHCPQLDLLLTGTVDQATAGAVPFRFLPRLLRAVGHATV
jgi:CubicO group peptidase (beta-lactamase class C family)